MSTFRPWHILAGLGTLDRRAVCDMLAIFNSLSVANVGMDKVRDWRSARGRGDSDSNQAAFETRVQTESTRIGGSSATTDVLRFRLWSEIRSRLGLDPALPLSTSSANARSADVAFRAAKYFKHRDDDSQEERPSDFSGIVRDQVKHAVYEALQGDGLSTEERQKVKSAFPREAG